MSLWSRNRNQRSWNSVDYCRHTNERFERFIPRRRVFASSCCELWVWCLCWSVPALLVLIKRLLFVVVVRLLFKFLIVIGLFGRVIPLFVGLVKVMYFHRLRRIHRWQSRCLRRSRRWRCSSSLIEKIIWLWRYSTCWNSSWWPSALIVLSAAESSILVMIKVVIRSKTTTLIVTSILKVWVYEITALWMLALAKCDILLVLIFELTLFFWFEFLILLSPTVITVHNVRIKLYKTKVMSLPSTISSTSGWRTPASLCSASVSRRPSNGIMWNRMDRPTGKASGYCNMSYSTFKYLTYLS